MDKSWINFSNWRVVCTWNGWSFCLYLAFFGRERIIVSKEFIVTDKPLVFFYRRNFYDIETISNIHIDKELFKINRNGEWKDEQRTVIKFDTPEKQVTFARGIDNTEAEKILLEMAKSTFLLKTQFAVEQKI